MFSLLRKDFNKIVAQLFQTLCIDGNWVLTQNCTINTFLRDKDIKTVT